MIEADWQEWTGMRQGNNSGVCSAVQCSAGGEVAMVPSPSLLFGGGREERTVKHLPPCDAQPYKAHSSGSTQHTAAQQHNAAPAAAASHLTPSGSKSAHRHHLTAIPAFTSSLLRTPAACACQSQSAVMPS